jgi:glucokinase
LTEIVAVDVGGTHARFALAEVAGGRVVALGEPCTLKTVQHSSLQTAWEAFRDTLGRPLPPAVCVALAGPVQGEVLQLTNNPWIIQPALLPAALGVERFMLINDFGAVGHAVAQLDPRWFSHVCGPDEELDAPGVISIVGPGTGLGVAQLLKARDHYHVVETEGGHVDFAPLDALEDAILLRLRERFRRVSVERLASGQGLANIYEALAGIEGRAVRSRDDSSLWTAALGGADSLAAAALDRLCLILGATAGDIALAQGARAVVIAGGVGLRLADRLASSGFHKRFVAKGRFERMMAGIPVKVAVHPQPGLYGAAAAFAAAHGD